MTKLRNYNKERRKKKERNLTMMSKMKVTKWRKKNMKRLSMKAARVGTRDWRKRKLKNNKGNGKWITNSSKSLYDEQSLICFISIYFASFIP